MDDGNPLKSSMEALSCLKFCDSSASALPCSIAFFASKSRPLSWNTINIAVG
jgi:hypothetical protein